MRWDKSQPDQASWGLRLRCQKQLCFSAPSEATAGGALITNGEFKESVIGAWGRAFLASPNILVTSVWNEYVAPNSGHITGQ